MMRRRASPSARTTRSAPTAPWVPVDRDGAPVPRSDPPDAGPVTGKTAPARAWKVDRSVAQGRPADPTGDRIVDSRLERRLVDRPRASSSRWPPSRSTWRPAWTATTTTSYGRRRPSWRARRRSATRFPAMARSRATSTSTTSCRSSPPTGISRGLLPFPPLPAVILLPFVAIFGLATNDHVIFTVLAGVDVLICYWMLGRLPVRLPVRLGTTIFFAFGTVFWYAAQLSTTWYEAHIVAVGFAMLAIGVAIGSDPEAIGADAPPPTRTAGPAGGRRRGSPCRRRRPAARFAVVPRQFVAGLLFGLATTARLSVIFGAPFFAFVGAGRARGGEPGPPASGSRSRSSCCWHTTSSRAAIWSSPATNTCTAWRPSRTRGSATTRTGRSRIRAICRRMPRSCS